MKKILVAGIAAAALAGCSTTVTAPSITAGIAAGCAAGQVVAAAAQVNVAAVNKPGVAADIALAQQLASTDCAAALQAIAAAKAASAPVSK